MHDSNTLVFTEQTDYQQILVISFDSQGKLLLYINCVISARLVVFGVGRYLMILVDIFNCIKNV